jgi:geranylgeranylglycerol-phosphate geranylgeranyltransferase
MKASSVSASREVARSIRAASVSAYPELARWQNCLISGAGVLFGAWWAGWANPSIVALAAASAMSLTAAGNALNDARDADIDRVAHPTRPVPSGRVNVLAAAAFGMFLLLLGLVLAEFTRDLGIRTIANVAVWLIFAYSPFIKPSGLPGNIVVAALGSAPFLYGALAAGNGRAALVLIGIAFPLHFAREIAKDIDDMPGDLGHRRTVPIRWGLKAANALILVALLAFAVQIVPVARAWPRLVLGIIPALAFAVYAAGRSLKGAPGAPRAFKAAMLCAMAAFVIARV